MSSVAPSPTDAGCFRRQISRRVVCSVGCYISSIDAMLAVAELARVLTHFSERNDLNERIDVVYIPAQYDEAGLFSMQPPLDVL